MERYISILEESLEKKSRLLDRIAESSDRQRELLARERMDPEAFDECVDEKGRLIEELESLDEGFEALYDRVREELEGNRARYRTQIERMKKLITAITEKSVSIQATEARNKKRLEEYFSGERAGIGSGRKSSRAAYDYYKSMSKGSSIAPQFMDHKR